MASVGADMGGEHAGVHVPGGGSHCGREDSSVPHAVFRSA